ncbi:hypothetical protein D8X55_03040 [Malacoplasma penetrans]|uniref:Uncharacterized protein n=1 Tax=Malacoplasma penetrans (strain HF-2) TaxID=272633 RepID=Q8EUT8_MALP2|nr:hypothetical protein [Malacoplasma penetrans]RXY96666.1 hypothetical protein D8X55_03040 [Malacoplasma penetrans]BAC44624.1 conserved hypothetical protein [Malacoplasma penetrans HF-2]
MNEEKIKIKADTYKSIFKLSVICLLLIIFIIPFAVFSILTFLDYLNIGSKENLTSFVLLITVLSFLTLFYVLYEIILFKKIYKNKEIVDKKYSLLSYLNFIFTFITILIPLIYSIKSILQISKPQVNFFKKKSN